MISVKKTYYHKYKDGKYVEEILLCPRKMLGLNIMKKGDNWSISLKVLTPKDQFCIFAAYVFKWNLNYVETDDFTKASQTFYDHHNS